jgi:hypothetical protein
MFFRCFLLSFLRAGGSFFTSARERPSRKWSGRFSSGTWVAAPMRLFLLPDVFGRFAVLSCESLGELESATVLFFEFRRGLGVGFRSFTKNLGAGF